MLSAFTRRIPPALLPLVIYLFLFHSANATDPGENNFSGRPEMNGYAFSKYAGFEKKWRLVTVRYRKDTGEMRFTYANEIAWKALLSHSTDYPDGAIFGKVGLATEEDPAFASSAVPSGARRYQFMVRNKQKHANTDGWGYALFDARGKTFPDDPVITTRACAACHHIVPNRGYVFSEPAEMGALFSASPKPSKSAVELLPKFSFRDFAVEKLPESLRGEIPQGITKLRLIHGPITKNVFQGTLDEIRPTLAQEALQSRLPAMLWSDDRKNYSLVLIDEKISFCKKQNTNSLDMLSLSSDSPSKAAGHKRLSFCQNEK